MMKGFITLFFLCLLTSLHAETVNEHTITGELKNIHYFYEEADTLLSALAKSKNKKDFCRRLDVPLWECPSLTTAENFFEKGEAYAKELGENRRLTPDQIKNAKNNYLLLNTALWKKHIMDSDHKTVTDLDPHFKKWALTVSKEKIRTFYFFMVRSIDHHRTMNKQLVKALNEADLKKAFKVMYPLEKTGEILMEATDAIAQPYDRRDHQPKVYLRDIQVAMGRVLARQVHEREQLLQKIEEKDNSLRDVAQKGRQKIEGKEEWAANAELYRFGMEHKIPSEMTDRISDQLKKGKNSPIYEKAFEEAFLFAKQVQLEMGSDKEQSSSKAVSFAEKVIQGLNTEEDFKFAGKVYESPFRNPLYSQLKLEDEAQSRLVEALEETHRPEKEKAEYERQLKIGGLVTGAVVLTNGLLLRHFRNKGREIRRKKEMRERLLAESEMSVLQKRNKEYCKNLYAQIRESEPSPRLPVMAGPRYSFERADGKIIVQRKGEPIPFLAWDASNRKKMYYLDSDRKTWKEITESTGTLREIEEFDSSLVTRPE